MLHLLRLNNIYQSAVKLLVMSHHHRDDHVIEQICLQYKTDITVSFANQYISAYYTFLSQSL